MSQRLISAIAIVATTLLLAVLAGVVGVLYARPATAQSAIGVGGMRQVTVQGHAEVRGRPDTATVQIGVETEAPTAAEALAQNSQQAQAIQQKLVDLGVAEKDIQTSTFNIFPVYGEDGRQIRGYHVSNAVSVTIRDLDQAGGLLDQVVQAGANSITGISFSVSDPKALLDQARQQAMQDARSRADLLARAGGASLGQVLVINESAALPPPIPMGKIQAEVAQGMPVPIQPGEQTLSVDLQVTYSLQ
ncbi:MAG TPA: SIMPL domain-containing protein [Roseiflexaceae bacterium]|nr:SIMPL domain-containing protein [Roseiflexaceae bacterium]